MANASAIGRVWSAMRRREGRDQEGSPNGPKGPSRVIDHNAGNGRPAADGRPPHVREPTKSGGETADRSLAGWQNAVMPRSVANGERPGAALVQCVGCGLEADGRFTVAENWTWWANGQGALVPHCPACSHRRFGHRTTLMDDLLASARDPLRHDSGDPGS
jgi:hypothetical protein